MEKQENSKSGSWYERNKKWVIIGGVVTGVCIGIGIYVVRREFAWRDSLISELMSDISKQWDRIDELEELCEIKDKLFSELMSDALRHRSSLAAQHMADKKLYLKNVA